MSIFSSIDQCTVPTDMRKSYDGLCGCVERVFDEDPLNGNLFVFFNRKRTMVKMLLWERSVREDGNVDIAELLCILDGIELEGSTRKKRFSLQKKHA